MPVRVPACCSTHPVSCDRYPDACARSIYLSFSPHISCALPDYLLTSQTQPPLAQVVGLPGLLYNDSAVMEHGSRRAAFDANTFDWARYQCLLQAAYQYTGLSHEKTLNPKGAVPRVTLCGCCFTFHTQCAT